jgi:hypothetical protein
MINDSTAVSETLGYILLFAIALTAIAIILLIGNSIISNEKSQDNFQNMIQSFNIIQSDMNQVALEETPVMTTLIHMAGGTITANQMANEIQVYYPYNSMTPIYDNDTGNLTFATDTDLTTTVSIENGGVWQKSSGNYSDTMVAQPRIYITPQTDTLVLNLIRFNNSQPLMADAGIGTLNIEMMYNNTYVYTFHNNNNAVNLSFNTDYPDAWSSYLSSLNGTLVNVNGDNVLVTVNTVIHNGNTVVSTISPVSNLLISDHVVNTDLSGIFS